MQTGSDETDHQEHTAAAAIQSVQRGRIGRRMLEREWELARLELAHEIQEKARILACNTFPWWAGAGCTIDLSAEDKAAFWVNRVVESRK